MEEEKIEKYKLLGVRKRHSNKSDRDYHIAYVLFENNYGFEVLNVMIQEKQVNALNGVIDDDTFDLTRFMKLEYNSFNKRYEMKITFGL